MKCNDDGSITLNFDETKVRVKAPKVGQYRQLRERIYEVDEQRPQVLAELREQTGAPEQLPRGEAYGEEEPSAEQAAAWAKYQRSAQERNENVMLDWWKLVLLGEDEFPALALDPIPNGDPDGWPMELTTAMSYSTAMAHWVAAPLLSGDSPAPPTN